MTAGSHRCAAADAYYIRYNQFDGEWFYYIVGIRYGFTGAEKHRFLRDEKYKTAKPAIARLRELEAWT